MKAFAAESDLALRIRRTLGGSARRMGTRAGVLAAVLRYCYAPSLPRLCPLVALPRKRPKSRLSQVGMRISFPIQVAMQPHKQKNWTSEWKVRHEIHW